ncbi:hypothetical protein JKP88DRAFT_275041 [Tribonema minus]|uniref:Uncharacterized protein n=1 Tax=Tribonema minus TaxID=303371 RepID=A0A836CLQ3_9STRA|nr:hypothetical protein JKP88DRAFT_275041 [Tribonema minus]
MDIVLPDDIFPGVGFDDETRQLPIIVDVTCFEAQAQSRATCERRSRETAAVNSGGGWGRQGLDFAEDSIRELQSLLRVSAQPQSQEDVLYVEGAVAAGLIWLEEMKHRGLLRHARRKLRRDRATTSSSSSSSIGGSEARIAALRRRSPREYQYLVSGATTLQDVLSPRALKGDDLATTRVALKTLERRFTQLDEVARARGVSTYQVLLEIEAAAAARAAAGGGGGGGSSGAVTECAERTPVRDALFVSPGHRRTLNVVAMQPAAPPAAAAVVRAPRCLPPLLVPPPRPPLLC